MKVIESVEQYLSSIDIGLLDTPMPSADSVEDVLALLGAKDEREAIGVMYQTLSLVEVYFNRIIQHVIISSYNAARTNADKPVSQYFDSMFHAVNELAQGYQQLVLSQKKNSTGTSEISEKFKALSAEYEALKKKLSTDKMAKEVQTDFIEKAESDTSKLEQKVAELTEKLAKEKDSHENTLRTITMKEIEIKALSEEIGTIKCISEQKKATTNGEEETFESILRVEMQTMKTAFERKIEALNSTIAKLNTDFKRKLRDKEEEVYELKKTNELLHKRFKEISTTA